MISIAFQDLMLTVIATTLVVIAVAASWFAYRASRTLERYDQLAPTIERVGLRAEAVLAQTEAVVEELRGVAVHATSLSRNGTDGVDTMLGLVQQVGAVGVGIRSAVNAFQNKRRSQRAPGG